MITTNRPGGAWGEILGDTTVAAAVLDRLLHSSVVITLGGDSYRLRNNTAAADELRRITTGTMNRPGFQAASLLAASSADGPVS